MLCWKQFQININMRCIEISAVMTIFNVIMININMRCIEICSELKERGFMHD